MRLLEKDVFVVVFFSAQGQADFFFFFFTTSCGPALFLIVCLLFQENLGKQKDLSASNDSLSENTKVSLCLFFFGKHIC